MRSGAGLKGNSDDEKGKRVDRTARFTGTSGGTPFGGAALSQQLGTQAGQPRFRNKQLRKSPPSNDHQLNGIISRGRPTFASGALADETWRDPTSDGNGTYNKRMSELYQTVCFHPSSY